MKQSEREVQQPEPESDDPVSHVRDAQRLPWSTPVLRCLAASKAENTVGPNVDVTDSPTS